MCFLFYISIFCALSNRKTVNYILHSISPSSSKGRSTGLKIVWRCRNLTALRIVVFGEQCCKTRLLDSCGKWILQRVLTVGQPRIVDCAPRPPFNSSCRFSSVTARRVSDSGPASRESSKEHSARSGRLSTSSIGGSQPLNRLARLLNQRPSFTPSDEIPRRLSWERYVTELYRLYRVFRCIHVAYNSLGAKVKSRLSGRMIVIWCKSGSKGDEIAILIFWYFKRAKTAFFTYKIQEKFELN